MNVDDDFWKTVLDNLHDGVFFVDRERRISYWNKGAEKITGFSGREMVGSLCWKSVQEHMDGAAIMWGQDLGPESDPAAEMDLYHREEISFLHREGHRIPIITRTAVIRDFRFEITGAVVLFSDNQAIVEARERIDRLEAMALLDTITQLGNRRFAETQLQRCLDEFYRYGWPFGFVLVAVDDFDRLREIEGQKIADRAIKTLAKTLEGNVRSSDILCRWEADQLSIILLNLTTDNVIPTATKLLTLAESSAVKTSTGPRNLTVSIGTTLVSEVDNLNSLVARAKAMVEQSKKEGGNVLSVAAPPEVPKPTDTREYSA
jgi:diguanylate cyclase (GGDEF)-like protein/PAS domain S-box-containing protein